MRSIHDAFHQFLRELPEKIIAELVAKKIADHGITLSRRERESLADQLRRGTGGVVLRRRNWQWWRHQHINLELTPADIEQATRIANEMVDRVPEFFTDAMEITAEGVLKMLRRK